MLCPLSLRPRVLLQEQPFPSNDVSYATPGFPSASGSLIKSELLVDVHCCRYYYGGYEKLREARSFRVLATGMAIAGLHSAMPLPLQVTVVTAQSWLS